MKSKDAIFQFYIFQMWLEMCFKLQKVAKCKCERRLIKLHEFYLFKDGPAGVIIKWELTGIVYFVLGKGIFHALGLPGWDSLAKNTVEKMEMDYNHEYYSEYWNSVCAKEN